MITRPSKFKAYQNSTGIERHLIVKIVKGSNTWLFSDCDMQLTDGHVYPLLRSQIQISESVDIFSKQWRVGDLNLKLSNVPYKTNSSGTWLRLSDEWSNVIDADITVYLSVGRTFTALSDCLVRYVGKIVKPPECTDKMLTLKAIDEGRTKNIDLPKRAVIDECPDAPNFARTEKIPIAYGKFYQRANEYSDVHSGVGLARGIRYNDPTLPNLIGNYILTDHLSESYAAAYYNIGGDITLQISGSTSSTSGPEGGSVRIANAGKTLIQYVGINESPPDYCDADAHTPTSSSNAHDGNHTTQANVLDHVRDKPDRDIVMIGEGVWGVNHSGGLRQIVSMSGDNISSTATPTLRVRHKNVTWQPTGAFNASDDSITYEIYYSLDKNIKEAVAYSGNTGPDDATSGGSYTGTTTVSYQIAIDTTGTPDTFKWRIVYGEWSSAIEITADTFHDLSNGVQIKFTGSTGHGANDMWYIECEPFTRKNVGTMTSIQFGLSTWTEYGDFRVSDLPTSIDGEFMVSVLISDKASSNGDSSEGNFTMLKVGELDVGVWVRLVILPEYCWAEIEGREFGSWIDAGGRSNSYNEGNLIEDPAFIIESLLRDEAGISSSDIDTGSFDDAANSSVKARINLHSKNELTLEQSIRQLCEQSTFAYVYTAAGKAKLIPLSDSNPTTATRDNHPVKIPFSHIKDGIIKIGKTSKIINHLTAKSRYQQEYGVYRDKNVTQNSTSQTSYSTWKYNASWPNICGTSATHIANHLVGAADGIWANSHPYVEITTVGFTGADIEIGDWIELDSTTVDPQIKLFGSSWSGKQLLVIGLSQTGIDGTKINAIQLY